MAFIPVCKFNAYMVQCNTNGGEDGTNSLSVGGQRTMCNKWNDLTLDSTAQVYYSHDLPIVLPIEKKGIIPGRHCDCSSREGSSASCSVYK